MKTAFVRAPSEGGAYISQESFIPPLGIGYISAFLRSQGLQVIILDGIVDGLDVGRIGRRIVEEQVRLVGISAMTPEIQMAAALADTIKAVDPGVKIVIGGVHAISLPLQTMNEFSGFDFLVTGEGEVTMWELHQCLVQGKSPEGIQGIVWRRNSYVIDNGSRPWIEKLDELPFPAWDLYSKGLPCYFLLSSRGCPFRCNFCMRVLGDRVRYRSPENVVEEMEWVVGAFHPRRLIFQDETFTLYRKRIEILLDLMIARQIPRKVEWVVQTRVDMVDAPLLKRLKKAGCSRIEFGIESGSTEILKGTKKGIDLAQARQAVKDAKKEGLFVSCSFIFGHPNETRETIQETIRFCQKLNPDNATFGIMVPYPKTEIASLVEKREQGYTKGPQSWEDFTRFSKSGLELKSLGYREMESMQVQAYLRYFLYNMRLFSMAKYMWNHRIQVVTFLKKFVRGR